MKLILPSGDLLEMRDIRADSSSTCSKSSGAVRISYISIGGEQISPDQLERESETKIDLPGDGYLILNERSDLSGWEGTTSTVVAAHLVLPGTLDVLIASAESGVTNCRNRIDGPDWYWLDNK